MSSIYHDEQGAGRAIIFLHGFCESREIWSDFVKPLAENFRILIPDLPGFGKSPLLAAGFTIDDVADEIVKWIGDIHLKDAFVVGHSLGGYVALSLAERHPEKISAIGLFHSTVFADSDEKKESRDKVSRFVNEHGVLPYVETFVPGLFFDKSGPGVEETFGIAKRTNQQTLIAYLRAMRDRPDRSLWWRKSKIQKLVIAGKEDTIIPLKTSREMCSHVPSLALFELEKTAHMGFFEAKNESQSILTRFAEGFFSDNSD